jgi:basic membrane protein A and related proteins
MTSMLKRVDNAVTSFVGDFVEGNVEGGTDNLYDLSNEGVGLSTTGGFIEDIQPEIDEYAQQIIDGEIEVPTTVE